MENKKTTEVLDELGKLSRGEYDEDAQERIDELMEELARREPFTTLMLSGLEDTLPDVAERMKATEYDIKLLKRHKHDDRTGDVLVRI